MRGIGRGASALVRCLACLPAFQTLQDAAKLDAGLVEALAVVAPGEFLPVDIVLSEQFQAEEIRAVGDLPSKVERREVVISLLKSTAGSSQGPLVSFLEARHAEGRVRGSIQRLWIHNVVSAEVTSTVIGELAARSDVARVHHDPPRDDVLAGAPSVPGGIDTACGVELTRAPEVWQRFRVTGRGVIVGLIDTGLCPQHPDLRERLWKNAGEEAGNGIDDDRNGFVDDVHGWNFRAESGDVHDDPSGHGSFVAGIVVGHGASGVRCGVAPGARIMTLKVWNSFAGEVYVWRSIEYGLENGAHVLSGSLGWARRNHPDRATWRAVCENAIAAGAVVIFAAGNDGCNTPDRNVLTPADVPGVIAVGAVDCEDEVQNWFSACGPVTWEGVQPWDDFHYPPGLVKPDVVAPGAAVTSHDRCGGYRVLTGTSTATPHAAGLAALLLEVDPTLDHSGVKALLEGTARDLLDPGKDNRSGAGRIDAFAAVQRALLSSKSRRR